MKKLIVLFIVMCSFIPLSWAMDGCNQHLSPDEFRAKQKAYITEKAGLTKEEAAKFFPVYFELQDRKKRLNDEAWNLLRKGRDEKTTEAQYNEIVEGVYDARIATNRLEKTYNEKFKKILFFISTNRSKRSPSSLPSSLYEYKRIESSNISTM